MILSEEIKHFGFLTLPPPDRGIYRHQKYNYTKSMGVYVYRLNYFTFSETLFSCTFFFASSHEWLTSFNIMLWVTLLMSAFVLLPPDSFLFVLCSPRRRND